MGGLPYNLQAEVVRLSDVGQIMKRQTDRQIALSVSGNLAYTSSCQAGIRQEGGKNLPLVALSYLARIRLYFT
ncbi:hypothetical protein NIB75_14125 [Bacteroides uniformis]|nr:hypothetical protein [Bacteroides uniformis]